MKSDPDNRDLVDAFEALRAEDICSTGSFQEPDPAKLRRWRTGRGLQVVGFAAAVAVVISLFNGENRPDESTPAGEPIAFDHLNEVISRELFVATASDWESPTEFLLSLD